MKRLAAVLLSATLLLGAQRAVGMRQLGPCVTTDPVSVLGQPILPSETECVPPQ